MWSWFAVACALWLSTACSGGSEEAFDASSHDSGAVATDAASADAPPFPNTGCANAPLPSSAPDPILLNAAVGLRPISLGTFPVDARRRSDGSIVVATTTDSNSDFTLEVPTDGEPFDGYVRTEKTGHVPVSYFPGAPFAEDWVRGETPSIWLTLWPTTLHEEHTAAAGLSYDASKGIVAVLVGDCTYRSFPGVTVSITPSSGALVYNDYFGEPDPSATVTGRDGHAWIYNMEPGEIEVSGDYLGTPLRTIPIRVASGEMTIVQLLP